MAIAVNPVHILRMLLQADTLLSNLQRDMRNNALSWKAIATAQALTVATLAEQMNSAAVTYQGNLDLITTAQADTVNWNKIVTMWGILGGTGADFTNIMNTLSAVASQLGPADKSTYAAIISDCDQIIAAVNAPLSLWPE